MVKVWVLGKIVQEDIEIFFRMQHTIFKYFALWKVPKEWSQFWRLAHKFYFFHILIWWMVSFDVCCLMQIIMNFSSLNEIIKVFFIFATALSVMSKFLTIKLRYRNADDIFEQMRMEELLPVNSHEEKIYRSAMKLSRNNRNVYLILSLLALNLVLGTQFIIDNTELPISIYMPINTENNIAYISAYLYQYVAVSVLCLTNIAFDSIASSFFIYLKGQLHILCNRLQFIGANAANEKDYDDIVTLQLIDCVQLFERIQKLTEKIETICSVPMSVQIVCSVLVLIANFYAMAFLTEPGDYANFLKIFIYQLCMLTQIFILCYFANEVSLQSRMLSYSLYSSEWVKWNKFNRRLALLMMLRFDTPIRIKSINGCYSFNLVAFTSIVNSSYSYFALLKKMNK